MSVTNEIAEASQTLAAFDAKHEGKKQALIRLGEALREGSWQVVNLVRPATPGGAVENGKKVHAPVSVEDLIGGDSVVDIIAQRRQLVERLEKARLGPQPQYPY